MRHAAIALGLALLVSACDSPEKTCYAIEDAGVVLGYLELWTEPYDSAAGEPVVSRGHMLNRLTLLGKGMDVEVFGEERADPATGDVFQIVTRVITGSARVEASCAFSGDTLHYSLSDGGVARTVVLDPDVVVGRTTEFGYLCGMNPGDPAVSKRVLEPFRGTIHEKTFTPVSAETLLVSGVPYDCVVFDTVNETIGVHSRMWVQRSSGMLVRDASDDGASITLSNPGVRARVQRHSMDDRMLAEVEPRIEEFRSITRMTVRATIRAAGEKITPASLNVPGQRFSGTVQNNLIDGEFVLEYPKYDGDGAPPFPPPPPPPELGRYLEPELGIECDDPAIVRKAAELTAGAGDSWEAAKRLSRFVATEIGYDIPGGGTARGTLRTGTAECGGHSRLLAALCRAAGIPARLATGCMYTTIRDGSFGQHAWNEVYMGEAGWIPVDATVREVDYVDSGHIRLGSFTTFNPVEMEILDYTVGPPVPDPLDAR